MRDIKFRIWDGTDMIYLPQMKIFNYGNTSLGFMQENQTYIDDDGYDIYQEIMQYTGLLDKNGKEIYEGDIISSIIDKKLPIEEAVIRDDMMGNHTIKNIKIGEQHIIGKAIYEIRWIDWGCKFEGVFVKYEPVGIETIVGSGNLFLHPDSDHYKLELEVIGNKFENPELLSN